MPFDLSSAQPLEATGNSGFDLASAKEINHEIEVPQARQKADTQKAQVPEIKGYWAQRAEEGKGILKDFATLGDMAVSSVGGLAANIQAMGKQLRTQLGTETSEEGKKLIGKSHKEIGQSALLESNALSEEWSGTPFTRALSKVLPEGEVKPSDLQTAMTSLGENLPKAGAAVEKATKGAITSEEFQLEFQFLMNAAGTKGLVKSGGKLLDKASAMVKGVKPEVAPTEPTTPPVDKKPPVDFKTYQEFVKEKRASEAAPKETPGAPTPTPEEASAAVRAKEKMDYREYQKHLRETADAQAEEHGKAKAAAAEASVKGRERPTHPDDARVYDATEKLKEALGKSLPRRAGQAGGITIEQAYNLAAISLGAAAGAYLDPDNRIVGAWHGMLLGTLGTAPALRAELAAGKTAWEMLRGTGKAPVDEVRATPFIAERNGEIAAGGLASYRASVKIHDLVPEGANRIALTHAIDQGKRGLLTGPMRQAADLIHQYMLDIGNRALKAGVLDALRTNYITHIVAAEDIPKAMALFNSKLIGGSSTTSPFAKMRTVPTIAQLKAAGIRVVTEDAGQILTHYAHSMELAIANKNLAKNLQVAKIPGGKGMMAYPSAKAPAGYVDAGVPGLKVHPDLQASIEYMFKAQEVNGLYAAGLALNTAVKRMEVMNPLFHGRSLLEARIGSTLNWFKAMKEAGQFMSPRIFGENDILHQVKYGAAGDDIELLLRKGLVVTFEDMSEPLDSDIRGNYYKAMGTLERTLDKHLGQGAGAPVRVLTRINHKVDNMLWGRMQAGWKIGTALEEMERVYRNAGKKGVAVSKGEAARIAARMNNLRYGSLDWHMIAEETNNRVLRNIALHTLNEKGRAAMGVVAFAPDWKASTLGAFIAQFEKGSGAKGLWSPTTLSDLARQQQLRTALYYATVVNGINLMLSGHYIWENDKKGINWMWIDRGDGTKMSGSKHALEAFHAMDNPGTFAISSLGVIPSEILDQVTGTSGREYNYVGRDKEGKLGLQGPPMEGGRLNHALKRLAPIGTPDLSQGLGPAAWGVMGYNVYGKTEEQRRADRKMKRERDFQKRLEKLRRQQ